MRERSTDSSLLRVNCQQKNTVQNSSLPRAETTMTRNLNTRLQRFVEEMR